MWSPATPERHPKLRTESTSRMKYSKSVTWFFLLTALLTPVVLHAADADNQQQQTIQGTIVDEQNQPAPNVKVIFAWMYPEQGQVETRTNGQGQFTLRVPFQNQRGHFLKAVGKSGQRMAQYSWPLVMPDRDSERKNLRLKLQPARRVELHVVDAAEKPIPHAQAGVLADYRNWGSGQTDEQGRIVFHLPRDLMLQYAYALGNGQGADYKVITVTHQIAADRIDRPPVWPETPVQLKLEGARPVKVLVTETDGTPIPGVKVYPWYIQKPKYPDLTLSNFNSLVSQTTNADGVAVFEWIPRWQQEQLTFWPSDQRYEHRRAVYDPQTGKGTLTLQLEKLVPISGKVTLPDGAPARGVEVTASGENYQPDDCRKSVFTDDQGRYTILAAPNMIYLLTAGNQKWASAPHTGFALWPGKPIEDLDFQLRPATRIHGRLAVGPQHKPLSGYDFYFYQLGQDLKNTKDIHLPNPRNSRQRVQPLIAHHVLADADGNFEASVGDGTYVVGNLRWIASQNSDTVQKFEIKGEREKELNFHALRLQKGTLTGKVVTGDSPQPVPDVRVVGIYALNNRAHKRVARTDNSGTFQFNRDLRRTVLFAQSKDRQRAGIVEVGPDDTTVTIPLRPLGTVSGQLVDEKTKQPLTEVEINYDARVRLGESEDAWEVSISRQSTITDQAGRFKIEDLVPGQKYRLTISRPPGQPGKAGRAITVETVRVKDVEPVDLGVLEVEPLPSRQQAHSLEERITDAFTKPGTPLQRFARQKREAQATTQYNLVLFGDPQSDAVKRFMSLRNADRNIRLALYSFLLMAVDTTADKRPAAEQLAKKLDQNLTGDHADFLLVVTDEQGKQLAHADHRALSTKGVITGEQMLTFLESHTVPVRNAKELLAKALQQARQQNKRVLIQETATWCGPCRLLSRYLTRERKIWERDYIWVKLDDRWTGTREVMQSLGIGPLDGIPWCAILDKDGKVLVTSNDKDGKNIGFPAHQSSLAHFREMLEKTTIRLNSMEINELIEALTQKQD